MLPFHRMLELLLCLTRSLRKYKCGALKDCCWSSEWPLWQLQLYNNWTGLDTDWIFAAECLLVYFKNTWAYLWMLKAVRQQNTSLCLSATGYSCIVKCKMNLSTGLCYSPKSVYDVLTVLLLELSVIWLRPATVSSWLQNIIATNYCCFSDSPLNRSVVGLSIQVVELSAFNYRIAYETIKVSGGSQCSPDQQPEIWSPLSLRS